MESLTNGVFGFESREAAEAFAQDLGVRELVNLPTQKLADEICQLDDKLRVEWSDKLADRRDHLCDELIRRGALDQYVLVPQSAE